MSQQVDIPNVGLVEFPDSMSHDDIVGAIKTKIMPQAQSRVTTQQRLQQDLSAPVLPVQGLLGQLWQAQKTNLPQLKQTLTASAADLFPPPQGKIQGAEYAIDKQINPLNALMAAGAIPTMALKGLLGTAVNAAV